ncbi:MAG: PD40 domain-containing protein [Chloroflexi bacterium]|nr:PD40 domain-containing protein [Chloroflexota bacterium]
MPAKKNLRVLRVVLASAAALLYTLALASADAAPAAPLVKRADGAERLYAPAAPKSAQNPAYAPGGRKVLFTLFYKGYGAGRAGIYKLPLATRTPARVLDERGHESVNLPGAAWNAATKRLTFASDRVDTDEIWTSAPDGSQRFRVTHHTSNTIYLEPSFSPDGQWIVFEVDKNVPDPQQAGSIWKVRADGTQLTPLTDGPGGGTDDREPNWSPTGERIVFQRRAQGADNWCLYTMAPDGTAVQPLTTTGGDTDASWSPDGKWVVYSSDVGGLPAPNIFVISAQGGAPLRVTNQNTQEDSAPSWSPDGKSIAFESHTNNDTAPASLWRIAAPSLTSPTTMPGGIWRPLLATHWQ